MLSSRCRLRCPNLRTVAELRRTGDPRTVRKGSGQVRDEQCDMDNRVDSSDGKKLVICFKSNRSRGREGSED